MHRGGCTQRRHAQASESARTALAGGDRGRRPEVHRCRRDRRAQPQRRANLGPRRSAFTHRYVEAWTPIKARHPDVLLYPTMASGGARGPRSTLAGDTISCWPEPAWPRSRSWTPGRSAPERSTIGPTSTERAVYIDTFSDTIYMIEELPPPAPRAERVDLRSELPADRASLPSSGRSPARNDDQAVLRR